MDCPEVWARMAILNKQLKTAEAIYLEQNQIDKAINMYQKLHKWDEGNVALGTCFFDMEGCLFGQRTLVMIISDNSLII